MKKWLKWLILLVEGLLILTMGLYLFLAFYYRRVFAPGIWINGIYCTGMTVEQAAEALEMTCPPPEVLIEGRDGGREVIHLEPGDYEEDFRKPLARRMKGQDFLFWPLGLAGDTHEEIYPSITCGEGILRAYWENLELVRKEGERADVVEIHLTEEGYTLYDGASSRLKSEEAFISLCENLEEGQWELNLVEEGLYESRKLTGEEEATIKLWDQLADFQDCGIVYRMWKEDVVLDAAVTCNFLEKDEDGMPLLDEEGKLIFSGEGVKDFIENLARQYDTCGKERSFLATRGEWVTVKGGTYGLALDVEAEKAYLEEAFLKSLEGNQEELHIPTYRVDTRWKGARDIGDTYIEVDMTEQKLYYYEQGERILEAQIVTGDVGKRRGTPQGVNYVYMKQKNRTLRGADYAAFVKYWMPVKGNVGIHDAGWRGKFGGTIYKTNGSHGCINVPSGLMGELYDRVEVGTPVVMFY